MHYVLGDIHGMEQRFDSVLEQIQPGSEDSLYILGDVVDRGSRGIALLRRIMDMEHTHMLLGNHEYMMLQAVEHPTSRTIGLWYRNGGAVTHESFKRLSKEERFALLDFLHTLPLQFSLTVEGKAFLLVHGVPVDWYEPGDQWYDGPAEFAVWERLERGDWKKTDRTLIFGHTPTAYYQRQLPMELWYGKNMIGIDCGAPYGEEGRLACLRLEDGAVFYSR